MASATDGAAGSARLYKIDSGDSLDRSQYIGGSEVFKLFNEPFYGQGCARELAYEKLGTQPDVISDPKIEQDLYLQGLYTRGHVLEDLVAKLYAEQTRRALLRRSRLALHPLYPKAGVHTDRIIIAHQIGDKLYPTGDCEIKTKSKGPFLNILRNGLPAAHELQLQWSMWITGHLWGAFVIAGFFEEFPIKHFDRDRDPAMMKMFPRVLEGFWTGLQNGQLPSKLDDPSDLRCRVCKYRLTCRGEELEPEEYHRMMAELEGKRPLKKIEDAELDEALYNRAIVNGEMKDLEETERLITQRIKELLGNEETAAIVNGRFTVYCDPGFWSGLDQKRLRAEEPEIFQRFYIQDRPTGKMTLRAYAIKLGKKKQNQ